MPSCLNTIKILLVLSSAIVLYFYYIGEIVEEPLSESESHDQSLPPTQSTATSRSVPSSTSSTLVRPAASSNSVRVVVGGGAVSSYDNGAAMKKMKPSPIVWGYQSASCEYIVATLTN